MRTLVTTGMQRISWGLHAMLLYAASVLLLSCESNICKSIWLVSIQDVLDVNPQVQEISEDSLSWHHITNGDYCLIPYQITCFASLEVLELLPSQIQPTPAQITSSIVHREVGSGDSVTFCIWMECAIMVYHMRISRHILTSLIF